MIIGKNDEERRSKVWRIVTFTATVVIIVIATFLMIRLFTSNPLDGTWKQKDGDLSLSFSGGSTLNVKWDDLLEGSNVKIKLEFAVDKDSKTLTIKPIEKELEKSAKASDGAFTTEILKASISPLTTTFDYSVDGKKLTLTEREYGEQMVFIKK